MPDAPTILLAAATLLERTGWCQREGKAADGSLCMVWAVMAAAQQAGVSPMYARVRLAAHLGLHSLHDLTAWNDAPDRTLAQVMAALRGAAGWMNVT